MTIKLKVVIITFTNKASYMKEDHDSMTMGT